MLVFTERSFDFKRFYRSAAVILVLFYLSFHSVSGERGLFAWFKETRRLESLNIELNAAVKEREVLETRIKHLSNASLDLDLLDERARIVLGYAGRDEAVILTPDIAK